MSFRIRLPTETPELDSLSQASGSEASFKRKPAKRSRRVDSDEEEDYKSSKHLSPAPSSPHHGRSHTEETGSVSEVEANASADTARFQPYSSAIVSSLKQRVRKPSAKAAAYAPPVKRKRRVISEPESEEEYVVAGDLGDASAPMDEEDDFEVPQRRPGKAKARTKPSGKGTKGSHLERNRGGSTESVPLGGSKRARPRQTFKSEDVTVDVVGDFEIAPQFSPPQSPAQIQEASPPPPPKKRARLPTIKKNKAANSVGPSTPSTSSLPPKPAASLSSAKPPILENNQASGAGVRKTPATVGNADFDLRNANVYRELFKTTGGATPRSGLNRREKDEERRKELNKLRDEARAKRSLEAKQSFDLQGQTEKIARFEERLRRGQSSALYPNFLAAKWRELWEREKKRLELERIWTDPNWTPESREEGEMNDGDP